MATQTDEAECNGHNYAERGAQVMPDRAVTARPEVLAGAHAASRGTATA
jgi:hypothetical protein